MRIKIRQKKRLVPLIFILAKVCTKSRLLEIQNRKFFWGGGTAPSSDPSSGGVLSTPHPSAPSAPSSFLGNNPWLHGKNKKNARYEQRLTYKQIQDNCNTMIILHFKQKIEATKYKLSASTYNEYITV